MADNPTPGTAEEQPKRRKPRGPGRPWPKGVSGNPAGRTPTPREFKELARAHSVEALNGLIDLARDPSTPPAARVRAWDSVIDRGQGKPTQPLEHAGADGGALTVVIRREGETK